MSFPQYMSYMHMVSKGHMIKSFKGLYDCMWFEWNWALIKYGQKTCQNMIMHWRVSSHAHCKINYLGEESRRGWNPNHTMYFEILMSLIF